MIKLTQLFKEIKITTIGTKVYGSIPKVDLYKVTNFPQGNIDDPQVKEILNKIVQDLTGKSFDKIYGSNNHEIIKDIDALESRANVYVYIAGDMSLSIVDSLSRFDEGSQTEEEWKVEDWREI